MLKFVTTLTIDQFAQILESAEIISVDRHEGFCLHELQDAKHGRCMIVEPAFGPAAIYRLV